MLEHEIVLMEGLAFELHVFHPKPSIRALLAEWCVSAGARPSKWRGAYAMIELAKESIHYNGE